MKRILQRAAFFGFLGCLALIALASHTGLHVTYKQNWKGVFSTMKSESKESLKESEAQDNDFELIWRGKIFNYFID